MTDDTTVEEKPLDQPEPDPRITHIRIAKEVKAEVKAEEEKEEVQA